MERNRWDFPSYEACCAICKGPGCAKFHGFYSREVTEENGQSLEIWIARYLCHRKGKVELAAHKTFSLLPHLVIPYRRYSAPTAYNFFKVSAEGGSSKALDHYQAVFESLCERTIFWMMLMFQVAFQLLLQAEFVEPADRWQSALVSMVESYSDGLSGMISDFYAAENQFLLGTASQKRRRASEQPT
ncbi:DUF6431 domain-containing protein [bacterium]|nr:DUF6431 domain-containing protein [bacterium]